MDVGVERQIKGERDDRPSASGRGNNTISADVSSNHFSNRISNYILVDSYL